MRLRTAVLLAICIFESVQIYACTSAIVSSNASRNGNPLLWKHRDTSISDNYVDTVKSNDSRFDYIALFNANDSLKQEAWAGVNRAGFAIINTVAGNMPQNRPYYKDREGYIMSAALRTCITVEDFSRLLDTLPRPMGVRTNFGVIDASGRGGYFEADDYNYRYYSITEDTAGVLIRSNYAFSGQKSGGYGYDRYDNARSVLMPLAASSGITPELLTDFLSCNYYTASSHANYSYSSNATVIKDGGFIPRPTSAASVVIELSKNGPIMWTILGYPPAGYTIPVTLDSVPAELKRNPATGKSDACNDALARKAEIIDKGKIRLKRAREISNDMRQKSFRNYDSFRKNSSNDESH